MKTFLRALALLLVTALVAVGWNRPQTPLIGAEWLGLVHHIPGPDEETWLSGTIEATTWRVSPEVTGRLLTLPPREGNKLSPTDVVATIDSEYAAARKAEAEALALSAKARLEDARAGTRVQEIDRAMSALQEAQSRLRQMKEAEAAARANIAAARADLEQAKKDLADKEALRSGGAASSKDVTDARSRVDALAARVESWEAQDRAATAEIAMSESTARSAASQLDLLREGMTTQTLRSLEAQERAARAFATATSVELGKYTIKAARAGTVQRRLAEPGQVVSAGGGLLDLLDLDDMWVRVYVPEGRINRATLGREVPIRADAWPGKVFHGRIVQVSDQAEFTPRNTQTTEERTRLVFGVKVQILDGQGELRPGLPADVLM